MNGEGFMNGDSCDHVEEPWHNWRRMAAYVYMLICLFDFVVMPACVHIENIDTKRVVVELINAEDKKFALDVMDRVVPKGWSPLTLIGGGLFHLAFGAILTGAAVTKGFERAEVVKQNGNGKQKTAHHKGKGKKHREVTEDEEWDEDS